MHLIVIGGGVMGGGILAQLLKNRFVSPQQVTVIERSRSHRKKLTKMGVRNAPVLQNIEFSDARVILLAVKPQDAGEVLRTLQSRLSSQTLVISIMAGVTVTTLQKELAHKKVVRVMPNLASSIGAGVNGWIASADCTKKERVLAGRLLRNFGESVEMRREGDLDRLTAVSGSGPGYIFAAGAALVEAAQAIGFSKKLANRLVRQTVIGAGALLQHRTETLDELVSRVASKKGTTEAALGVLSKGKMAELWKKALKAAYQRARQLGRVYRS